MEPFDLSNPTRACNNTLKLLDVACTTTQTQRDDLQHTNPFVAQPQYRGQGGSRRQPSTRWGHPIHTRRGISPRYEGSRTVQEQRTPPLLTYTFFFFFFFFTFLFLCFLYLHAYVYNNVIFNLRDTILLVLRGEN
jgi:hypothetical protein